MTKKQHAARKLAAFGKSTSKNKSTMRGGREMEPNGRSDEGRRAGREGIVYTGPRPSHGPTT